MPISFLRKPWCSFISVTITGTLYIYVSDELSMHFLGNILYQPLASLFSTDWHKQISSWTYSHPIARNTGTFLDRHRHIVSVSVTASVCLCTKVFASSGRMFSLTGRYGLWKHSTKTHQFLRTCWSLQQKLLQLIHHHWTWCWFPRIHLAVTHATYTLIHMNPLDR